MKIESTHIESHFTFSRLKLTITMSIKSAIEVWGECHGINVKTFDDTPVVVAIEDLQAWEIRIEDCAEYVNYVPLVVYLDGIRYHVLYRNINKDSPECGSFKRLTVWVGSGCTSLDDVESEEKGLEAYAHLVQGANLYK